MVNYPQIQRNRSNSVHVQLTESTNKQNKAGLMHPALHVDEAAKSFSNRAITDCRQPITRERRGKEPPITEEATTNAHATN